MRTWIRRLFSMLWVGISIHAHSQVDGTIDEAWLRAHMLFGPEVTFTNPILRTIHEVWVLDPPPLEGGRIPLLEFTSLDAVQTHLTTHTRLTQDQRDEVIRFLRDVLEATAGTLSLNSMLVTREEQVLPSVYDPERTHSVKRQPITFRLTSPHQRPLIVTVEAGCIEVNQAPRTLDDLREAWAPVFQRAEQHGFVGNIFLPGRVAVGGGGNLHVGFKDPDHNLFLLSPEFLRRLLLLPLTFPGIMYALRNNPHDFGEFSNNVTPLDVSDLAQRNFVTFLSQLDFLGHPPSPSSQEFLDWLNTRIPPYLRDHFSYLRLLHSSQDIRIEIRFQRAYMSVEELYSVAYFWLRSFLTLLSLDPKALPPVDFEKPMHRANPTRMVEEFQEWVDRLGLPAEDRERLLRWPGPDSERRLPIRHRSPHVELRAATAYPMMYSHVRQTLDVEVTLPAPPPAYPSSVYINGEQTFLDGRQDGDQTQWTICSA